MVSKYMDLIRSVIRGEKLEARAKQDVPNPFQFSFLKIKLSGFFLFSAFDLQCWRVRIVSGSDSKHQDGSRNGSS